MAQFLHVTVAVSVAIWVFTSCTGKLPEQCRNNPAGIYRDYLHDVKTLDSLSFEELARHLRQWQAVRDSVFTHVRKDTPGNPHDALGGTCARLHDSLRAEFSRLALSKPRTYRELLHLKRRLSPYANDKELYRTAKDARPFFRSLDGHSVRHVDEAHILSAYRALLAGTLRDGIHGTGDMMAFIKKEDAIFRAFLPCLHNLDGTNIADITRDTEKCCSQVLLAAGRNEIPCREAVVYLAMRTNRRLILNMRACINDIAQKRIKTADQAHACIWMLLQPYVSLDSFCMAVLSPEEQEELDRLAAQTQGAFEALCRILPSSNSRLADLPGMLMEIYIHTL